MLTINQISFATFSFLAFFLGLKAFMERNKFELTKTQNSYWLKSVTAFFTTNVSFLVGSFDFSVFILIANTSIMFYPTFRTPTKGKTDLNYNLVTQTK